MAAILHTEGRQWMFEICLSKEQTVPATLYVGLCTDTTIAENAVLADLGELTDTDYVRWSLPSSSVYWTSAGTGTNDWKMTSGNVAFAISTSGITWTKAESWFLATSSDDTGKLIATGPLNAGSGWTLSDPDELNFNIELTWAQ